MRTSMREGCTVGGASSPGGTETGLVVHVWCFSLNMGMGGYRLVSRSMGMDHWKVPLSLSLSDVTGTTTVIDHRTGSQSQTSQQVGYQLISVTSGLLLNRLRSDTFRHAAIFQMAVVTSNGGTLNGVDSLGFMHDVRRSYRSLLTARH